MKPHRKHFVRPYTYGPVAATYRLFSKVGLPRGHEAHYHPDTYEVCFILKGRLDWWVGDQIYEVRSGDVLAIAAGVPHGSVDSTLQPCEYYAVHLCAEMLAPSCANGVLEPNFSGIHRNHEEASRLVVALFNEHEQPDPYSQDACGSIANMLVTTLARDRTQKRDRKISELVQNAQRALLEAPDGNASIQSVAKQLAVSTVWLNRSFQTEIGQSAGEWVRQQRIVQAKDLLASPNAKITEIAVSLGFTSSQYFATAFHRETGMSPSRYRDLVDSVGAAKKSREAVCAKW